MGSIIEEISKGTFILNITFHIFILYTILCLFFNYYIKKLIVEIIGSEIDHIVDNLFKNNDLNKKYEELKEQYNNLIEKLKDVGDNLEKAYSIKEKVDRLRYQMDIVSFVSNENKTNFDINSMVENFKKSIKMDYYLKLYKKEDKTREFVNKQLLDKMVHINYLLLFFTLFITGSLLVTKSITYNEVGHVFVENILTFTFVGMIEIMFFIKIASKYIPAPPSLIYKAFFESMRKNI